MASDEKTEKATPKRREDARKKGQVVKSNDLNSAFILLSIFGILKVAGPFCVDCIKKVFLFYLSSFNEKMEPLSVSEVSVVMLDIMIAIVVILIPIFLTAIIVSTVATLLQTSFLYTTEPLKMNLGKLNPIAGFKRIFSIRAIAELIKATAKFIVLAVILWRELKASLATFASLSGASVETSMNLAVDTILSIAFKLGIALAVIGVCDYLYQWWEHEKNIRMTKQEIKDEYKQIEGDPKIKSKIKQRQTQMSMMRMMNEVLKADVIITNPTHYAIAIKYDEKLAQAPIVLAKGKGYVAQRIKEKARENKIEMVENRPLAQALYATVDIGQLIPPEFYAAVAEILVKVYNL